MGAEKTRKPFFKNWINWLWLTPTLISVVFILHQVIFQLPRAKQFETKIQREFSLIPPLPGATQKRHNVSHKTSQALVDATYVTNVEVANIFKHYNDELTKQGWQFFGVRGMKDWEKDPGGKSFYYCKQITPHIFNMLANKLIMAGPTPLALVGVWVTARHKWMEALQN